MGKIISAYGISLKFVCVKVRRLTKGVDRNFCRNERNFQTILAIEESINPEFKGTHVSAFTDDKKLNEIATPTKLIETLGLTCMVVERGKHGDVWMYYTLGIAFAMWLKPEFGTYVLTDYEDMRYRSL